MPCCACEGQRMPSKNQFNLVGPWDQNQVIRLDEKCLYSWTILLAQPSCFSFWHLEVRAGSASVILRGSCLLHYFISLRIHPI